MSKHREKETADKVSGAPKQEIIDEPSGVSAVEKLAENAEKQAKKARKEEKALAKAEKKARKEAEIGRASCRERV